MFFEKMFAIKMFMNSKNALDFRKCSKICESVHEFKNVQDFKSYSCLLKNHIVST